MDILEELLDVVRLDHADGDIALGDDHEIVARLDMQKLPHILRDHHLGLRSDGDFAMHLYRKI